MSYRTGVSLLAAALLLGNAARANADSYQIGPLSQQLGPGRASIGASLQVTSGGGGRPGAPSASGSPGSERSVSRPPAIPTLSSNSPMLHNPMPVGPNSFWYTTLNGLRCIYFPNAVTPCFNVVRPGTPGQPPVNPAAIAASAASRLALGPGRIEVSPSARANGLTGADSWFWLSPSPGTRSLSVSVGREHVTVTASAKDVRWIFGDGASLQAGPGVPYRSGPAPASAVVHRFQTRCLPGDQGDNPYVLASCGSAGYAVSAALGWTISYSARGPVTQSGSLPSRTTSTSLTYPVSEARGFLATGASG